MRIREALCSCLQGILHKLNPDAPTGLGELDGVREDQEKFQRLLNRIRATLRDAERMEIRRENATLWLQDLKDLAGDIEDVLDDFEYEELRHKVAAMGVAAAVEGGSSCGSCGGADCFSSQYDVMTCKIADIWTRFNEITSHWKAFTIPSEVDDGATQMEPNSQTGETSSFLTVPQVFGRDKVKEEIIEFLKSPVERLSILAIVGIGGLGKTTLAQFVYNDIRDFFHQSIWVHVSHNFDVKIVTRRIIEHVADPQLLLHQMDNLDMLQLKLGEVLRDKRFLLVLDDVWYEDDRYAYCTKWQQLCAPLKGGVENGCKILITTRSTEAADITQQVKTIELEALAFDDCWSLLKKHAFPDENAAEHPRLQVIGKEIVQKLNGVPLAATTIGGLLKTELDEQAWRSVLESELWELEQGEGGILPALRLSYEHLPPDLKPCFAYMSVYAKGQKFDQLELLQRWMASGYIRSHERKRMEDVGSDYLNRLMSRSLIQYVDDKYRVHDLLHDLGRFTLQHDFCHIKTNQLHHISTENQCQHHVTIGVYKYPDLYELEKLQNFRKLRTCTFGFSYRGNFQIPCSLFMSLTCLRVLDLSYGGMQVLPDSIGNLRHLRYLDLRGTPIRELPDSLCSLYMLQTLKLQGCGQLSTLPKSMSNLVNLRYLEARHELVSKIHKIGKLTHLQEIDVFSISEGDGIKIEDLKDLDELRGRLCIQNLQRVGSEEEASRANLSNKKYIKKLELEWVEDWDVNYRNSELEEAVLSALLPPPNLKELTINFYDGDKFSSWMKHYLSISGLESISLRQCRRWDVLPPLLGQLPSLKTLDIACFPQLKELPSLPTTITNLRLQDLGPNVVSGLERLYLLQELVLCNIPNLRELPPLPTTLMTMSMENLGLKFLPEFYQVHGGLHGDGADNSNPFLKELKIIGCQNLRSLGGLLRRQLPYLTILCIKDCEELVFWPEGEGFRATMLSLLQELRIENCPKLMALPERCDISSSLKKLIAKGCPGFPDKSFFVQLQNMKNLNQAGDVYVEKRYSDLKCCFEEALQQMRVVEILAIEFVDHNSGSEVPFISLVYDIVQAPKLRSLEPGSIRRVTLNISNEKSYDDEDYYNFSSILSTCLHHHHLCSSLLVLRIQGMPNGGFLIPRGVEDGALFTPHLPSLQELMLVGCRDMGRLPVETLLCHLRQLKCLYIWSCPELTLPSVEEAIQSLPSLEVLWVDDCPKVSLPILDFPAHVNDDEMPRRVEDSSSSSSSSSRWCLSSYPPPSSSNSSSPLPLRTLVTDDVGLLDNGQFVRHHFSSLHELTIANSAIRSFPAGKEDCWLWSLRVLVFLMCPNLQELPPDLRSLAPSLEVLSIIRCPGLRCMPERGLPASLEVLAIEGSPGLEVADWPKVSHVRLIVIDRLLKQGSYSDYQEMIGKGKIALIRG